MQQHQRQSFGRDAKFLKSEISFRCFEGEKNQQNLIRAGVLVLPVEISTSASDETFKCKVNVLFICFRISDSRGQLVRLCVLHQCRLSYIIVQPESSVPVGMRHGLCHELHLCHCGPKCDIIPPPPPVNKDHMPATGFHP